MIRTKNDSPQPNLNQYAYTIQMVFEKLAMLYEADGRGAISPQEIRAILDADVCAAIIAEAKVVAKC